MEQKKETVLDEFGRKSRTIHLDQNGQLDYENVYIYPNDTDRLPMGCEQTYFRQDGTRERKDSSLFDRKTNSFHTTKRSFYDESNRKIKSEHLDSMERIDYVNRYYFDSQDSKRPNLVEQTYYHPDGTIKKQEELVYNEELNMHQTQKETLFDEMGRKLETYHFNKDGNLEFTNEYFYLSDYNKTPSSVTQIYFRKDGVREQKDIYNYNQGTNSFKRVHSSKYDREGKPVITTDYDLNGSKTTEKTFSKQNGLDVIHRKKFKDGAIIQEGDYVRLANQLVEKTPEIVRLLAEYDRSFGKSTQEQETTNSQGLNKAAPKNFYASLKRIAGSAR